MADNMDTYDAEARPYEDDNYPPPRDRSRSPLPDRDGDSRIRDEPANGRDSRDHREPAHEKTDPAAQNTGSNLFVTGIHPRLTEEEVSRLFEKYGAVEKCNIMKDPHTRESRGFGFVKMYTAEEADAAKEALQGEVYEGRTLSIEKARRARPRTPTPGKYFGPPKRDDGPPRRGGGGGYRDRYDDRGYGRDRRGGGGGYRDRYDDRGGSYGRRDDYGRSDRYRDDRRDYGGDRGERGDRGDRRGDRGDRGGDRGGDRRGYGGDAYERAPRPADSYEGGDAGGARDAPRDAPPARSYEPRRYD